MNYAKESKKLHYWYVSTQNAIRQAGGSLHVIELFPIDLMEIMVKNNLVVVYKPLDESPKNL